MQKNKIADVETTDYHPIYRRKDGSTWMKLNAGEHAPAVPFGDHWIGAGHVTTIKNLDEEVEVLHTAADKVA